MKKNLLTTVLLAAGLLCSTFSWAYVAKIGDQTFDSFTDAFNHTQANGGGTIVMYADADDLNAQCYIGSADITIDLNGKTISGSGYFYPNGKSLTIVDNSAEKTGKISSTYSSYLIRNKGTLTIEGGTFISNSSSGINSQYGTATLNNGHFACVVKQSSSGTLNIKGGLFTQQPTGTYTGSVEQISDTIIGGITYKYKAVAATPTASIGDTKYTSLDAAYNAAQENDKIVLLKDASTALALSKNVKYTSDTTGNFTLTCTGIISAGVFDCAVVSGTGLLRGGSFQNEPAATDVYTAMYKVEFDGSYYNVVLNMDKVAARIGTTYYTSLQEAFTDMHNNDTVTLLKNVVGEFEWKPSLTTAITLTLDLNGHSITSTTGTALRTYQPVGSGTSFNYTIKDTQGTGLIQGKDKAIHVDHNSDKEIFLTIKEGVNVKATDTDGYAIYSASSQKSSYKHTITIEGGDFVGKLNKDISGNNYYSLYVLQGGTYNYKPEPNEIATYSNYATLPWYVSYPTDPSIQGFVLLTQGYNYYQVGTSDKWEVLYGVLCNITIGESQHGTIAVKKKSGKDATSVGAGTNVYFINTPENGYKLANYVVNGAAVSPSEGIATEYTVNSDITVTGNFVPVDNVLRNETTKKEYESLVEAVEEAGEGDSIHVLKDFTISNEDLQSDIFGYIFVEIKSGNHIVIDLKGYTITVPETAAGHPEASLNISGYLTLQNGSIEGLNSFLIQTHNYLPTESESYKSDVILKELSINRGIGMYNLSKLTLDNVNINANNGNGIWMDGGKPHSSELIVNSGVYTTAGTTPTILVSNLRSHKVSINGGSFNNLVKIDGDDATYAKLSICGGEFIVTPAQQYIAEGFEVKEVEGKKVVSISGKRESLTVGKMGTICLQYGVTAAYYSGATFYEIAYTDGTNVYFDEVTDLVAGHAYVFEAEAATLSYEQMGEKVETPVDYHGLHGTFTDINSAHAAGANELNGKYLISNNLIQLCGDGCWLNANRAYIVMDEVPTEASSPAPGRRRIALGTSEKEEEMGLESIMESNSNEVRKVLINGQLYIIRGERVMDAQGRFVK